MKLMSVDVETTQLAAKAGTVWEVGVVEAKTGAWMWAEFPVSLIHAEPGALMVSDYYDRASLETHEGIALCAEGSAELKWEQAAIRRIPLKDAWRVFAGVLANATLLGASVHFDAEHLTAELRAYALQPAWSHRVLDLGSFYAAWKGMDRPASSKTMVEDVPNDSQHTALGDAKWNVEVYNLCCARS